MSDPAALVKYLDVFPEWLRTLGEDAAALGAVAQNVPDGDVGRYVVAGLNYVFKSLDLIADAQVYVAIDQPDRLAALLRG